MGPDTHRHTEPHAPLESPPAPERNCLPSAPPFPGVLLKLRAHMLGPFGVCSAPLRPLGCQLASAVATIAAGSGWASGSLGDYGALLVRSRTDTVPCSER